MTDANPDPKVATAVDNDILIKAAALDLSEALISPDAGVLGQARFAVLKRVSRMPLSSSNDAATERATALIERCRALEPDDDELYLAVEIEREATMRDLPLDSGESILAAIVILRSIDEFHTGDKRAIAGLEALVEVVPRLDQLLGRVRCLEQIVAGAVERLGAAAVGVAICAEPSVDKTLTICSECQSNPGGIVNLEALHSYVARLREQAPRILVA